MAKLALIAMFIMLAEKCILVKGKEYSVLNLLNNLKLIYLKLMSKTENLFDDALLCRVTSLFFVEGKNVLGLRHRLRHPF